MDKKFRGKKPVDPARLEWLKAHQDARWERYADYCIEVFSAPSFALPRAMGPTGSRSANPGRASHKTLQG